LAEIRHCWIAGTLLPARPAGEVGPQQEFLDAPGPYTTARIEDGRAVWAEAHFRRLLADTRALGLPRPAPEHLTEAFEALGRAEFGSGSGIVRVKACSNDSGELVLVAEARALGADPAAWRAGIAPFPHPGPGAHPGAKLDPVPEFERARALCRGKGLDELLFFDQRGCLVEGARSSLVVVSAEGSLRTPAPELGGVASIALARILARSPLPILSDKALRRETLTEAREIIALNAARGARPICELDGAPVGEAEAGPIARILRECLEDRAE